MANSTYIPFDHTYIVYDPKQPWTLILALSSILPIIILIFLFSWFLTDRELEPCIIAGGQVVNDLISTLLKQKIRFARPIKGQIFKKDGHLVYGMPSSHSQFIMFFSTYMILKMSYQWPYHIERIYKIGAITSLLLGIGLIIYSRLFFSYHTIDQVVVGCFLGTFLSCGYFGAISILRDYGLLNWFLKWKVCELLRIKDSFHTNKYRTLKEERDTWEDNFIDEHINEAQNKYDNKNRRII